MAQGTHDAQHPVAPRVVSPFAQPPFCVRARFFPAGALSGSGHTMRTLALVLAVIPLAAFAPLASALSPPQVQACSDLVPASDCGLNWVCVSVGAVGKCVRDLCWNTATCYGANVRTPTVAIESSGLPVGVCIENRGVCEWYQLVCVYETSNPDNRVCVPDIS